MPADGRPAAFLGGVGQFTLQAEASAKAVRVGQEFDLRIRVSGPAAWGMTERPELLRYDRVPLRLRIRPGPTETKDEPPERTFIYHLRPTRAGEAVLPPVSIAAFEPSLMRYITHTTPGVPIGSLRSRPSIRRRSTSGWRPTRTRWPIGVQWFAAGLSTLALAVTFASLAVIRRHLKGGSSPGSPQPGDMPQVWLEASQLMTFWPNGRERVNRVRSGE